MRKLSYSVLCALLFAPAIARAQTAQEVVAQIDASMNTTSDYKAKAYVREKRPDNTERAVEFTVYRSDIDDLLFFVSAPPSLAGTGYLRIGKNLWEYSALAGQWERRTRRADIIGTITCESDFDRSRMAIDYNATEEAPEEVNGAKYRKFLLKAKPGVEVTFMSLRIWVDSDLKIVKREGYAPSGKPLRTDIIKAYMRLKDPKTGKSFLHFREVFERQAEGGTVAVISYDAVELEPLNKTIFTKAWLEGRMFR